MPSNTTCSTTPSPSSAGSTPLWSTLPPCTCPKSSPRPARLASATSSASPSYA
jgi:hypothetical protein